MSQVGKKATAKAELGVPGQRGLRGPLWTRARWRVQGGAREGLRSLLCLPSRSGDGRSGGGGEHAPPRPCTEAVLFQSTALAPDTPSKHSWVSQVFSSRD